MRETRFESHTLKKLSRAMSLGAGLLALSAHGQGTVEVGGVGVIGDTVLDPGSALPLDIASNWSTAGNEAGTGNFIETHLVSPAAVVTVAGNVTLTFDHRYFTEADYDGGGIYVSKNGAPATYVPLASLSGQVYEGPANLGTAWSGGEDVFNGKSPGYDTPAFVQTVADLGTFAVSDTVSVEFRHGSDEGFSEAGLDWEINTVKITDAGAVDILDLNFPTDGPSGFTLASAGGGTLTSPWNYPPPFHRFEIDADLLTSDTYSPNGAETVIDLNGANIVVEVLTGTLDIGDTFTLFSTTGSVTLTGSVGTLSLPPGVWDTSSLETDGTITVLDTASPLIYEPFADLDSTLNGNTPGLGLDGTWSAASNVAGTSLTYGKVGYQGGRVVANLSGGNFQQNGISPGTTLTGAGLLDDGATLWFSCLIVNHADTSIVTNDHRTYFAFGTGNADGFDRVGDPNGGFTVAVSKVSNGGITAQAWNDGHTGVGATRGATDTSVPEGDTFLVVGKITWGAFGVTDDVFELYLPDKDLNLGSPVSTIAADFDQLGVTNANYLFDRISCTGGRKENNVPEFDEIRFAGNSADVLPLDFTAPILVTTDNASGSGTERVATFDEELYVGTGDIRIVNETTPGTTTITLPDPQVVLSGNTLTITPTVPLSDDAFHIEIDAGALTDRNLNAFGGISDPDLWEFTVDGTPPSVVTFEEDTFPLISGLSPAQVLTNASLTYTVTFDEPIDPGTVEVADFAGTAGSVPVTVDSVTATGDPAVFEVGVSTGGTTGTLTLEIVASAVISDINGNDLDTTTAIPSDNTVNVVDPVANAAGIINDFQGTISSQLNDLAVTNPPGGEGRFFHVSVNPDNPGTGWYCADLPGTGDPAPAGVRNFTGPVVAYKMLGNGGDGNVTSTAGASTEDPTRITYETDDPTFGGFGQQQMKLWTTNDPGADLATGAGKDATGNASVGNYGYGNWQGATGIVEISGLASGSVHIYYGAYNDTPTLKVTLKDADNIGADIVIADAHSVADGGNGDAANNCEYYVAEIDFVSDGVYEYVEYEWFSSNGRGLGTVLTGPDVIATDPFADWSVLDGATGVTFEGDANGDGVQDGLAFLLGAANPNVDANAAGLLPTVTETAGGLVLDFDCLPIADRGTAKLYVQHSNDLSTWTTSPTGVEVPDAPGGGPTSNVTFVVGAGPAGPPALNSVTATIDAAAAGGGGKLFGRLQATE